MSEKYVGLMSGTSLDGVDAVVADFSHFPPAVVATASIPIPERLRQEILDLCSPEEGEIMRMGAADTELGALFAEAAVAVVEAAGLKREEISAIGSHGQTIRHEPAAERPFTLQIGDPNTIAQRTGITTVADFRRRDLAAGGQGAPLAPAYHAWLLKERRGVLVNIGGMANVTILPDSAEGEVVGYDTGPGNVLMNTWAERAFGKRMDREGEFARQGRLSRSLLERMREEPFFALSPPKSTGRETFNSDWIERYLSQLESAPSRKAALSAEDVAATLCELTAVTIADAVQGHGLSSRELWVCGGGARNPFLLERIAANLPEWEIDSTAAVGMDPEWVEAMAFAWLARRTLQGRSGNLPSVTGAGQSTILGAVFPVKSALHP